MLIRATRDACFVMLRNGLTLELVYDRTLSGAAREGAAEGLANSRDLPLGSCGVWLLGETVLFEVQAGTA